MGREPSVSYPVSLVDSTSNFFCIQLSLHAEKAVIESQLRYYLLQDREGVAPAPGWESPSSPAYLADSAYQGTFETCVNEHLAGVRVKIVNHPWTGIKGTYAPIGTKVDWDKIILKGFHILPRRWVVERTNAWITHHRRLSRDA